MYYYKIQNEKGFKFNSIQKILEFLYKDYQFSEQKKPKNKFKMSLKNNSRKMLPYQWTGTSERCY